MPHRNSSMYKTRLQSMAKCSSRFTSSQSVRSRSKPSAPTQTHRSVPRAVGMKPIKAIRKNRTIA